MISCGDYRFSILLCLFQQPVVDKQHHLVSSEDVATSNLKVIRVVPHPPVSIVPDVLITRTPEKFNHISYTGKSADVAPEQPTLVGTIIKGQIQVLTQ